MKKTQVILMLFGVLVLIVIVGLLSIISLGGKNQEQYELLTEKFYIPIEKSYNIVFVENKTGNDLQRCCSAELKVNESEYNELKSEMEKSGYLIDPVEWYDTFLKKNSDWLLGENVVEAYERTDVETRYAIYSYRIHMYIFVTESIDGYRHIYMYRN